jgi:hypothetical protein
MKAANGPAHLDFPVPDGSGSLRGPAGAAGDDGPTLQYDFLTTDGRQLADVVSTWSSDSAVAFAVDVSRVSTVRIQVTMFNPNETAPALAALAELQFSPIPR